MHINSMNYFLYFMGFGDKSILSIIAQLYIVYVCKNI